MSQAPQYKVIGGHLTEFKTAHVNGVEVGLISGHIATWDLDEGLDRFHPGAFLKSLHRHRKRPKLSDGSVPGVVMKNQHRNQIGVWPVEGLREDKIGLFGQDGQINLEVQEGQETFSKIRARHVNALSIGFIPIQATFEDDGFTRNITESDFVEGSPVDNPMNQGATITAFKARFRDLPVSAKDVGWEGYGDHDRRAFLAGDEKAIAQMVDGELMVCQERLTHYAESLMAEGKSANLAEVAAVEGYMAKGGMASPFSAEMRGYYRAEDLTEMTPRQLESVLTASGRLSTGAVKAMVGKMKDHLIADESHRERPTDLIAEILAGLKDSQKTLQSAMQ